MITKCETTTQTNPISVAQKQDSLITLKVNLQSVYSKTLWCHSPKKIGLWHLKSIRYRTNTSTLCSSPWHDKNACNPPRAKLSLPISYKEVVLDKAKVIIMQSGTIGKMHDINIIWFIRKRTKKLRRLSINIRRIPIKLIRWGLRAQYQPQ